MLIDVAPNTICLKFMVRKWYKQKTKRKSKIYSKNVERLLSYLKVSSRSGGPFSCGEEYFNNFLSCKEYGSPDTLFTPAPKVSNVINIEIQTIPFTKTVKKRLPRKITVQALQGIISKLFNPRGSEQPKLSYVDQKNPDIRVELDKVSKSLDFYSMQDGDVILVEWWKDWRDSMLKTKTFFEVIFITHTHDDTNDEESWKEFSDFPLEILFFFIPFLMQWLHAQFAKTVK